MLGFLGKIILPDKKEEQGEDLHVVELVSDVWSCSSHVENHENCREANQGSNILIVN